MHSFTSQPAGGPDGEQEQPDPEALASFSFELDGEPFACRLSADADDVLAYSEFAAAAVDDVDSDSPEGVALVSQALRLALGGPEYRRFRRHLKAHKTKPEVLMDIMGVIFGEMETAVSKRTGRPTGKPSPSSTGEAAQDERTARVISLGSGDVVTVPAPQDHKPPSRTSAKAKPKAGRGRPAVTAS